METNALSTMDPGPLTERQSMQVTTPEQEWSDSFALRVAVADFSLAENYRTQNHDWRWQNADALYLGYVTQKYWEGTKIPRANIPVFVAYEQIESIIPRVMQALFSDNPWFEANALGRTSASAARKSRDVILAQMVQCRIRKVIELGIRSGMTYGNGVWEASWFYSKQTVKKFLPRFVPRRRLIQHPETGQLFAAPTGGYDRIVEEVNEEEVENRPILECVSIKDFYIDPNCPTSDPNDARYTFRRSYVDVDYLDSLSGLPGFTIPSKDELVEMSQTKPSAYADNTKSWEEAARLGMWSPQIDQTVDPGGKRIEILCYKTDRRIVWIANRSKILYNTPNPYGRKLQYNFCYTDLIDRFYGLAITDVTEGEQRLQEGILNGRLDELALNIHASTVVKRGNTEPTYKLRVRPGNVNYSDDPSKDFVRQYTNNVTAQAFQETAFSDIRVQKITGQADTAAGGQNPVARSATGAGLQGQATMIRSQYQVEKIEYNVLEPILNDFHFLNQHHLDPEQMIEAVSDENGQMLDPMEVFGANVKFEMRASSRMQSRNGLLQIIPYVMQYAMNPQLQAQLTQQGLTLDYESVFQMLLDATGLRAKATWVRPLTDQEKAALKAAAENPQNAELQAQRERLAAMDKTKMDSKVMDLVGKAIDSKVAMVIAEGDNRTKLLTTKKKDNAD